MKGSTSSCEGKTGAAVRLLLMLFGLVSIAEVIQLAPINSLQAATTFSPEEKPSDDGIWEMEKRAIANSPDRVSSPRSYRTAKLNQHALCRQLRRAPMEFTQGAKDKEVVISVPKPDGTFARFGIAESSIMEPPLAARFPEIKTYQGQGVDDRTATLRCDWTESGFHATLLSADATITIEPLTHGDTVNYITYSQQDVSKVARAFRCLVQSSANEPSKNAGSMSPNFVSGATLRTYRLAMAATGEYTQLFGSGTVSGALAAITTAVNSFNAVFEREVSIRLMLIAGETSIIFTDPSTDGYTHLDPVTMADENQTQLDSIIGSANYDIGHVFDGGPNGENAGFAGVGVVCVSGMKGRGAEIQPFPPFDPIASLHEIGHQFGAVHTFNGTTGSCSGNRDAATAYEPGAGSTIMAYGTLCGNESLPILDRYYHTGSLQQIIDFSTTGSACAGQVSTGNHPPTVSAGPNFTVPKSTPFKLTATAGDVDGDMLTFDWEEFDLGAAAPPNSDADGHARPLFRSFVPATDPTRTFPSLTYILNNGNVPPSSLACGPSGTCITAEVLPTITRTMNFRVTARDNRAGGGGASTAMMQLNVRGDSGPFLVTQPNTAVTWTGGTTQTVAWSVSNTNLSPVSAANVRITLSTDGGYTFPSVLAASTPNDGTELITVPNNLTSTQCRIKVEAVGNVFFDISDVSFNVTPAGSCPVVGSLSQSIASVGTSVVITGAHFTGVTSVKFSNNVVASFTVDSDSQITTTVPGGAASGPITIGKPSCADAQTGSLTVSSSSPADLVVDDGTIEAPVAATFAGIPNYYVNRLTPQSYPATLASVSIYFFSNGGPGLQLGDAVTILVGTNADGDANINGGIFQTALGTIQTLDDFNVFSVPNITINSGDFVVGFRIVPQPGDFPAPVDITGADQHRSYVSTDGVIFYPWDDVITNAGAPELNGNFAIRARVFSGSNCPMITGINPTVGPPGTLVTISGKNFAGVTKVQFANSVTSGFTIDSDTQITTTVPQGAVSGPITLRSGCSDAQTGTFTINPTAIKLASFTATTGDGGTLIRWQTGYEADNLGFNLYRDEAGKRTRLNPQLVAGSALTAGSTLGAGAAYSWKDDTETKDAAATYWLEDIDLSGQSTWHGPFYATRVDGPTVTRGNATLLSQLGSKHQNADVTYPLEKTPDVAAASTDQFSQQVWLAAQSAVKIAIKREGWYRVSQTDLARDGLGPEVDPRHLQLFVDGRQVPIAVSRAEDGSFDQSSGIEFYGTGLDTPSTDERIYWLIAGSQPGLRIPQIKGNGTPSAANSFTQTVERRERLIYFPALHNGEAENFFGAVIAQDAVEHALILTHLDVASSKHAVLEVALQGVTQIAHHVRVEFNDVSLGEIDFDAQAQGVGKFDLLPSWLLDGDNRVRLIAQAGPGDISLVDHIRLSYQHTFTADDDALKLITAGGQRLIINGFTSPRIRVFDVTDGNNVSELIGTISAAASGYAIDISASENGPRQLLALTDEKARQASAINANQPSTWRSIKNAADLVIIARRDFFSAIAPLKLAREVEGYLVALVDTEDVYDEFAFGNKSPQAIKDFLGYAKANWQVAPRFVLFVGDASYDAKDYLGFGDNDLVPTKLIDTAYLETASDDWFADFDCDGVPDMAVGRLPARTPEEATAIINKLLRYRRTKSAGSALLISDASEDFDFDKASAQLRSLLPQRLKAEQIRRGELDDSKAKTKLVAAILRGQKVINYVGHGSMTSWRGNLLNADEARELTNANLPLVVLMTCLNGYFHDAAADSLGEGLIKAERGGAVAAWASSGITLPGEQLRVNEELYRVLFKSGQVPTLGEAVRQAKSATKDTDIRRTWILLGDPTLRLK
jgi:hypothetical protein